MDSVSTGSRGVGGGNKAGTAKVTLQDENGNPDPLPLAIVLQTVEQMEKHPSIRYIREAVEPEEFRRQRALA